MVDVYIRSCIATNLKWFTNSNKFFLKISHLTSYM